MFSLSSKPSDKSRAEYIASVEAARRRAALEEERKQRERLNLASEKEYPALGGGPKVPAPSFSKGFAAVAAAPPVVHSAPPKKKKPVASQRVIPLHEAGMVEPVEESDEINPGLFPTHRRGDKGTW